MKTPEEVLSSQIGYMPFPVDYPRRSDIIKAMKEYAQQWVEEAAFVAMDQAEVGLPVGDAILELKKQIQEQ